MSSNVQSSNLRNSLPPVPTLPGVWVHCHEPGFTLTVPEHFHFEAAIIERDDRRGILDLLPKILDPMFHHLHSDKGVLKRIANSRSLSVPRSDASPGVWDEEATWHTVGDVIGDIVGLGLILANIEADLKLYYHNTTYKAVSAVIS